MCYFHQYAFFCSFFDHGFFFLIELHELFVYFWDYSLASCFICKWFLPFCFSFCLCFPLLWKSICLIRSHLLIFAFIFITLASGSIKMFLWVMSKIVLCFPLKFYSIQTYIYVFNPSCKYFCVWYYECSNFIIFHIAVQFFQNLLLKRLSVLYFTSSSPLS